MLLGKIKNPQVVGPGVEVDCVLYGFNVPDSTSRAGNKLCAGRESGPDRQSQNCQDQGHDVDRRPWGSTPGGLQSSRLESNQRPLAYKAGALATELREEMENPMAIPHIAMSVSSFLPADS
jgi:hypothetical protein